MIDDEALAELVCQDVRAWAECSALDRHTLLGAYEAAIDTVFHLRRAMLDDIEADGFSMAALAMTREDEAAGAMAALGRCRLAAIKVLRDGPTEAALAALKRSLE